MSSALLTFVLLAAYTAFVLVVSWVYRTKGGDEGFAIGARKVGLWPTVGSLISGLRDGSGLTLWIFVGAAAAYQLYWFALGICFAFILYAVGAPKLRRLAGKHHYITQSDFVADRIGRHSAKIHLFVVLCLAILLSALQLFVAGQVISHVGGISKLYGFLIIVITVGIYLRMGGYQTLIMTDLFQWIMMSAIVVLPFFMFDLPPTPMVVDKILDVSLSQGMSMFMVTAVLCLAMPDFWQRIFSLRNPKIGTHAFVLTIPFLMLVTVGLSVFGYYLGAGMDDVTSKNILEKIFTSTSLSPVILSLVAVTVAIVTMSTLDTMTYLFTSTLAKNFYHIDPDKQHKKYVKFIRRVIPIFLMILVVLAYAIEDVISFLIDSYSLASVMAPLLIYGIIRKEKPTAHQDKLLALGLLSALMIHLTLFFGDGFVNYWYNNIPTALFAVFVWGQHYMLTQRKK